MPTDDRSRPADSASLAAGGTAPAADEVLERLRQATLGEYEILSEIARGGMASVYLAYDLALARKVAIKVMSPSLVFGEGMVERFKREARTSAALSHPNIIPVYTVRDVAGLCFFVMKLIQGTTLDAVMRQLGQTPLAMVEAVLAQAGGALGYAHRNGVIHRDVKPGNILIDDEGWVVVTDFGIAKVADAEGLTLTGMAVGTPAYMSPEQCLGTEVTAASDQYALGVIAFEMLTGQRPFSGASSLALMYGHANTTPPPIESLRPDCPELLRNAVTRMLAKAPAERWPSLEDLVAAIGARALAPDDPTRSQLVQLARTSNVAKLVARAQTPKSPVPITRARVRVETAEPPPQPRPRRRWAAASMAITAVAVIGSVGYLAVRPRPPVEPAPATVATETLPDPGPVPTPPTQATVPENRTIVAPAPPAPPPVERRARDREPVPAAVRSAESPTTNSATAEARPQDSTVSPSLQALVATETASVRSADQATARGIVPPPAAAVLPPADPRPLIEAAIHRYAQALEAGSVAEVRQAYPDITPTQQSGLVAFFEAGGTMRTQWTVRDVTIAGDQATARIVGTNRVTVPKTPPSNQPVDLRVRLVRVITGWRIVSIN